MSVRLRSTRSCTSGRAPVRGRRRRASPYGIAAYQHLLCDFDGDGVDGIVAFDEEPGTSARPPRPGPRRRRSRTAPPGYIPVCGDWDGDGADGIGVYDGGSWHLAPDRVARAAGGLVRVRHRWLHARGRRLGRCGRRRDRRVRRRELVPAADTDAGFPQLSFAYGTPGTSRSSAIGTATASTARGSTSGAAGTCARLASAGAPQLAYAYGIDGYRPLVGDADGDGLDGSGVVVP